MTSRASLLAVPVLATTAAAAVTTWGPADTKAILDKTLVLRLSAPTDRLGPGEQKALRALLQAGEPLHRIYELQMHHQAAQAQRTLLARVDEQRKDLLDLFRLFRGPIATTLDNDRRPILAVDPPVPGKSLYPWGVDKARLEAFLARHADARADLLDPRTVVREEGDARADRAALAARPGLAALHPGLRERMQGAFYAVPYALAYADLQAEAGERLGQAADAVQAEDGDLADYLRQRRRDFLTNDYEGGDAAWVAGRFRNLNAQLGTYETYDDELFGVKTFMGASIMVRDADRTATLRKALSGIQAIEDALPYAPHRPVREDLPVGVYHVVADFGQARGTNTATILPNESRLTRKYGRTIMLRYNVMTHPDLLAIARATWTAAVLPEHARDLGDEGDFQRTLWHEIGHYLGPDRDRQGRDLDAALQDDADLMEEMKADLVSLFASEALRRQGQIDDARLRDIQAAGILRVLNKTRPRRGQPYQTMQLIQMNSFLEQGLLEFDAGAGRLRIHYDKYPQAVLSLLEKVLAVQAAGDKAAADALVERYTAWTPEVHERLAASMRATETYRYRLVKYQALGE